MKEPIFNYDEISDTLYISFWPGESATGVELNDNILLRINKNNRYAVSLSIFNYSILAQKTEIGFRSLPLSGIEELSEEFRQLVLEIVFKAPVCDIFSVSAYTPSISEYFPIVTMHDTVQLMAA